MFISFGTYFSMSIYSNKIVSSFHTLVDSIKEIDLYYWILITFASILLVAIIIDSKIYKEFYNRTLTSVKRLLIGIGIKTKLDQETLNQVIKAAGYTYEPKNDIFYSTMNPWQRKLGYCRLYDESTAPLGMIIDCEPIYFKYAGKRWLIEFWKGQYDLTTGCEIGVYSTDGPDLNIPGVFNGTFYHAVRNEDLLQMSFSLIKNGETLFERVDKHWWLTGFKLGEFSNPDELTMNISITLKDVKMRNEFIKGLMNAGYQKQEILIVGNTVKIKFDNPRMPQPSTRTEKTDWLTQKKNELLCDKYQEITKPYDSLLDKINAIQEKAPDIYKEIFNIGKTKELFKTYFKIINYKD